VGEWDRDDRSHAVAFRHLQRFPFGTPYPSVVDEVEDMLRRPPLRGCCDLVVDATGVGRPVVDLFSERELRPVAVIITGGMEATEDDAGWRVPKRDLVSSVQVGLQSRTLRVARDLPEAELLAGELLNFQVKVTAAAHDTYGAWREGTHDDLVLAVALGCWWVRNAPPPVMLW
jgi:hypothetical protein